MKKTSSICTIIKKLSTLKIAICFLILFFLLTQNTSCSRYYTQLDTIIVRFTVDENLNSGVKENYEKL